MSTAIEVTLMRRYDPASTGLRVYRTRGSCLEPFSIHDDRDVIDSSLVPQDGDLAHVRVRASGATVIKQLTIYRGAMYLVSNDPVFRFDPARMELIGVQVARIRLPVHLRTPIDPEDQTRDAAAMRRAVAQGYGSRQYLAEQFAM